MKPASAAVVAENFIASLSSEQSQRVYRGDWSRFTEWAEMEGVEILKARPRHVSAYLQTLIARKKSRATVGHALSVIRAVYATFVREEMMQTNPAREIKTPRATIDPKTPWLTAAQARTLLQHPAETWRDRRSKMCIQIIFGLGWRRAEVARMRWGAFANSAVTGTVKGGKKISVGVPEWLQEALCAWRSSSCRDQDPVIPVAQNKLDQAVSPDMIYVFVEEFSRAAGVVINPHGLRRTYLTLARERGADLKTLQLSVGHASQSTTELYDRARNASKNAPGQLLADLVRGDE